MADPTPDVEMQDEQYDENADEDFHPEPAAGGEDADHASSSSSEDEQSTAANTRKKHSKRKVDDVAAELDSGDEATIQQKRKGKRRKTGKADQDTVVDDDEESGGEGGFIRTRAQRLAEKGERKIQRKATVGEVTIDVDKLWAELSSVPVGRPPPPPQLQEEVDNSADGTVGQEKDPAALAREDGEMVTIKRRIQYAGEVTEVEETVPRNSKEAQQYLHEHPETNPQHPSKQLDQDKMQRPLKRPSIFEPNPTGAVKGVPPERLRPRAPSRLDVILAEQRAEAEERKKAEKLTTVQKSALDWKGYVDGQGLREELNVYGKSGQGFLAREAFLDRAQGAREEAARAARSVV